MQEQITVESLAYGGDGIGHLSDGKVVFIAGAVPKDVALVDVYQNRSAFAKGRIVSLVEASPDRVVPLCDEAAALRCGGCPWAQVAYEQQLKWKRQAVVDAMVRIAKFDESIANQVVGECVASKKQWHYRNKVEFEVGLDVAGRMTLGMHAHGGEFTPLSACQLCPKKVAKAPKALTGSLRFALSEEQMQLERVGVRLSERTGECEVAIWTQTGRFPRGRVAKIVSEGMPVKNPGVARVLLKGDAKTRKIAGVESLAGHGNWAERIGEYTMWLSAPSFFQVNTSGAEKLVELVMDGLQPDGTDAVLDLYSGAGTFTLPLAEASMSVAAVESAGSSVRDLRRNLERNGLYADVIGGDVGRELPQLGHVDAAVVDPPRSGLAPEALEALVNTRARRIAYVSCDPSTLARDLAKMIESYRILKITPVDLFPQTYHVENVAILERR